MPALTPKQQRFVEEYLVDLSAAAAARRAGYKVRRPDQQGYELLRKPEIVSAIQDQRTRLAERTARTVSDVLADIGRVKADAMQQVIDPDTGATAMLDHKAALKALELEGKHLGAFDERMRIMGPDGGPLQAVSRIELVAKALPTDGNRNR